jgi:DNA-directed RNA polymerase
VAWIEERADEIQETACSPRDSALARSARDPLQFYAFAREWSAYLALKRQDHGGDFVSHLPCGQDGSCNGMQHFAALWRDAKTGENVNLLPSDPSDRPNDLYTDVADGARRRLSDLAARGNERALRWVRVADDMMIRVAIKGPVMTFVYGATLEGSTLEVSEYAKEVITSAEFEFSDQAFDAVAGDCRVLTESIWGSLKEKAPGAVDGRQWFKNVALAFVSANRPVSWKVPVTGLRVVQNGRKYMEQDESHRIKAGRTTFVDYRSTDRVDETKQVNGIAPNLTHSLDAAALVLTIERAHERGVRSLGVVHDCYHVLAADGPVLAKAAREAFVRLHEEPILDDLQAQFSVQVGEDTPPLPEKGSLDIRDVLEAEYFLT